MMGAVLVGSGLVGSGPGKGGAALAQSSSPFSGISGWFDGEPGSPLELKFDIEGDDGSLERSIRAASLVQGARAEGRITAQDILAAARGDYARILGTLYDSGYYDAVINITLDGIEAAQIAPLDAPGAVQSVTIAVQPGPQFRFSRADIAPVAPGTELPSDYRQGEPAGTGVMKSAAVAGVDGWRNVGHAKADVASTDIIADHRSDTVDSRVVLAPGPALTFGQLTIRGYERMDPRRLRKMAGFPEGERFDPEKIEDMRKRLRRSGVFSAITITETDGVGPGNTQDVDLLVIEQKTRRIGGGFELSNENGLALTGYWMHRNLLGGGERLRFDAAISDIGAETSGEDYSAGVRLDRPATLHPDVTGYLLFQVARTRDEDYDLDSATVGLGFTYLPSDWLTADIALLYNAQRVNDEGEKTDFRFVSLPMSVTWDRRDDQTDPTRGYWLSGNLTPFLGMDDTDSGARVLGEGRAYFTPGTEGRLTFAGRARLGTILGADLAQTPRDYLFYSGGGGSVRGQPYESLGVEVIRGPEGLIKTGGMSVANMSAEVRYQLREKIGLAVFADWGQVWAEDGFGGDSGSHSGAGIGVRYKTPIGPLRFDLAGPTSGDTGSGVQAYLGLGQAF
ncbi:autotransporter assembly complex protein TamA [Paracoccus sp. DMF-8]|uniref:autotransporter assembly complex protein TamA n=1 Tax=Paracoccus sp. DMF-8 TaxID=3019445 RepID=UPI0023E448B5|nr:autotransporter assembly complex family protein [Paracoccus sp. DMF-8]MDF3607304.1 autotransporter assembly complex protein TamA [Paracoccus sp. DMF-8]